MDDNLRRAARERARERANRLFEQTVRNVRIEEDGFSTPEEIKRNVLAYINSPAAHRLDLIRGLEGDTHKKGRYEDVVHIMINRLCNGGLVTRDLGPRCVQLQNQVKDMYDPNEIKSVTPSWKDHVNKFRNNFTQGARSFISRRIDEVRRDAGMDPQEDEWVGGSTYKIGATKKNRRRKNKSRTRRHNRMRSHRKRSHRKRSHRKPSHRKRSHRKRSR